MSVVQTVFSLLFELAGRIGDTANEVRNGKWAACPDFSFTIAPYYELSGRTLGIVGYGTIGAAVVSVAHALGMKILVNSRSQKDSPTPIQWVPLPDLLAQADIITLHCPLTLDTQGLINSNTLATMKPGAFLINTGRGPLIDEAAVADALHSGHLGGFAADVLTNEPPEESNPLLSAPRTVITPHIAWASVEARHRLMDGIVENLRAHLTGKSQNVVYP
jgi:glycerate dehydrogenase